MHNHHEDHHHTHKRYFYPFIIGLFFVISISLISWYYLKEVRAQNDDVIAEHIQTLSTIFKKINESCKITAFRYQKDYIDFLNVISFVGSQVGPMNLAEPKNWKGPYLDQNLTIEGKEYQIVLAKQGYYIIPGDGVKLTNGQIIGKTLKITPKTDMIALLSDPNGLLYKGKPLAAFIETISDAREKIAYNNAFSEDNDSTY